METLARAVGKWLEASKGELDRVTYASMRVNPNELLTAGDGHGDDDVCHDPDHDPGDDQENGEFGSDPDPGMVRRMVQHPPHRPPPHKT